MPKLAIIIVSYNTAELLRECLAAIHKRTNMAATEVVVVDNASVDGSAAMVRLEFPTVRLFVQAENIGFGAANNVGVAASTAPYVMLLNSDTVLLDDTGSGLQRYLQDHPGVTCVGPRIVLPDGQMQPRVFGNLPSLWRILMQSLNLGRLFPRCSMVEGIDGQPRPGLEHDVGWITGVCMVLRRADFKALGGFDPDIFMYCEDIDLCARIARRGGRIVRVDRFPVLHYGGASSPSITAQLRNAVWQQRNLLKVVRKQSGRAVSLAARLLLSLGLLLRLSAGLMLIPKQGIRRNVLLRSSWLRLLDLLSFHRPAAASAPDGWPT